MLGKLETSLQELQSFEESPLKIFVNSYLLALLSAINTVLKNRTNDSPISLSPVIAYRNQATPAKTGIARRAEPVPTPGQQENPAQANKRQRVEGRAESEQDGGSEATVTVDDDEGDDDDDEGDDDDDKESLDTSSSRGGSRPTVQVSRKNFPDGARGLFDYAMELDRDVARQNQEKTFREFGKGTDLYDSVEEHVRGSYSTIFGDDFELRVWVLMHEPKKEETARKIHARIAVAGNNHVVLSHSDNSFSRANEVTFPYDSKSLKEKCLFTQKGKGTLVDWADSQAKTLRNQSEKRLSKIGGWFKGVLSEQQ
jgi:phage-related protein